MILESIEIENFRAIENMRLEFDPQLTVLYGANAHGKTSLLRAIAVGLGSIPGYLPDATGIGFSKFDQRGFAPIKIAMRTNEGLCWERRRGGERKRSLQTDLFRTLKAIVDADQTNPETNNLPILGYYDTDRAVFDQPQRRRGYKSEFSRFGALSGALGAKTDFKEFFKWFYAKENEELRIQKSQRDFKYNLKDLDAVRRAITSMAPGVLEPRIAFRPLRFVVSENLEEEKVEERSLDHLSGGYRIILALAADLARRMAQGNPHLQDPLESEATVLIDEIELHPSWQQRVIRDLLRTFPNTQFILSTHSPQVLTTVKPHQIVELTREGSRIIARKVVDATYGAEAGYVLESVMGVDERPSDNEFVQFLNEYFNLITSGKGESTEAKDLRAKLETLSPRDMGFDRADIELRRQQIMKELGRSK